jgi:hypothetical protein
VLNLSFSDGRDPRFCKRANPCQAGSDPSPRVCLACKAEIIACQHQAKILRERLLALRQQRARSRSRTPPPSLPLLQMPPVPPLAPTAARSTAARHDEPAGPGETNWDRITWAIWKSPAGDFLAPLNSQRHSGASIVSALVPRHQCRGMC